ncbi:MAG: DNA-protecting protein DprA [Candidatus Yonathbacteria bacterium]|nr:DNA-protecting protein DprA [Candidatus Yonathbacteria bacterium]
MSSSPNIREINPIDSFPLIGEMMDPPKTLFVRGTLPSPDTRLLTIVGSRSYTNYGREACEYLIAGLAGYDVAIVSGLALGIDGIAHKAAMKAELPTIAVPGSGLSPDVLYPASHRGLADEIVAQGGALVSELSPETRAAQWTFPQRNRIMAGMSHATLIIEAGEKSGTLITARLALDYNREVLVVPHGIFSDNAAGSNRLLRQGAAPAIDSADILRVLGFDMDTESAAASADAAARYTELPDEQHTIMELLTEPLGRDEVIRKSGLSTTDANIALTALEIRGLIKESVGLIRRTR